ncbi:protein MNN4-like [Cucumis melo var. makuwa]|uniref:Protein MNN4-like n=2 Tax=Cucumis melo TaxID=3656 RepID=A0A5A7T8V8_CUCMM|nr:protein MNN4-like [Cucumis melo var. makuwa]TYK20565.1 protein MNN4-like [Cucumis melo var. makuwa]
MREIGASLPIVEAKFERVAEKAQKKTEQVKSRVLKIKEQTQGVKALVEEKLKAKMKGWKELRSKVEEVAFSVEKSKEKGKEKTFEEFCEEASKEIKELSSLKDDALKLRKKRRVKMKKKTLRE